MVPLFKRVELCRTVCVYVITSFFTIYHVYRFFWCQNLCIFNGKVVWTTTKKTIAFELQTTAFKSIIKCAMCSLCRKVCTVQCKENKKKCRFACVSSAFSKIRFCWNGKILIRTWQTSKRTYIQSDFHLHHRLLQADFIPKFTSFIPFQHSF